MPKQFLKTTKRGCLVSIRVIRWFINFKRQINSIYGVLAINMKWSLALISIALGHNLTTACICQKMWILPIFQMTMRSQQLKGGSDFKLSLAHHVTNQICKTFVYNWMLRSHNIILRKKLDTLDYHVKIRCWNAYLPQ